MTPAPPPRSAPRPRPPFLRDPAILGILLLCLIPEVLLSGADLGLWGRPHWRVLAWQYGGFWIGLLGNWRPNYSGQPWLMFASYGFLHGGALHFLVNMITLFSLGPALVEDLGRRRFLAIYAASLLGGALGFALLSRSPQPMVGASGALFGLAGAVLARAWESRRAAGIGQGPVLRAVFWLAGLNLLLWWAMNGRLAWETHLGGFAAGWILARLLAPGPRPPLAPAPR